MDSIKLKPCPFCGKTVEGIQEHIVNGTKFYRVRCDFYYCDIKPSSVWKKNKIAVIESWNQRGE